MPKYTYIATDNQGKKHKGNVTASDQKNALEQLRDEGKIVLSLSEENKGWNLSFGKPKLSMQDKMVFIKNLGIMVKVGITITDALQVIIDQTKKKGLKQMYEDILEMVKSGQTLAESLKKYDYTFEDIYTNMIATGEKSGNLENVLEYLYTQLEKTYDLRKKVISAFIYPAVIVSVTLLMAGGIVIFIMPKISRIFNSFDITLPLPTRILLGTSDFLTEKTLMAVLMFSVLTLLIATIIKLKALKPFWHRIILNLPIFGSLLVASNVARSARTMNSLIQAGIPITEGIQITKNSMGNAMYQDVFQEAYEMVEQGGKMGESLSQHEKLFPSLAARLIDIGEKTGTLEISTKQIAELYEREVDTKTKNLSTLLEPLLLVFMGLLVGGIALSIILPIYQLPNLIGQ